MPALDRHCAGASADVGSARKRSDTHDEVELFAVSRGTSSQGRIDVRRVDGKRCIPVSKIRSARCLLLDISHAAAVQCVADIVIVRHRGNWQLIEHGQSYLHVPLAPSHTQFDSLVARTAAVPPAPSHPRQG